MSQATAWHVGPGNPWGQYKHFISHFAFGPSGTPWHNTSNSLNSIRSTFLRAELELTAAMPQIFKVKLRSFGSLRPDLSVCARAPQKTLQGPLPTGFSLPPRPADSIFHPYGFPCFSLSANTLTPSPLPSVPHALHGLFSAVTPPSATRLCIQWPCHLADNLCSQFCISCHTDRPASVFLGASRFSPPAYPVFFPLGGTLCDHGGRGSLTLYL